MDTTVLHNCSVTPSWIRSISCKTWTLLGHCICTSISKTCALCISKAGALLVHVECTSLGNSWELPCLLLWILLAHYTGTAWVPFVHYTGTAWVLLVHIQYSRLGGYCFGTPDTLELHAWVSVFANKLSTSLCTTCTLPEVVHLCLIIDRKSYSLVPRPLPDFISQPWRKIGTMDNSTRRRIGNAGSIRNSPRKNCSLILVMLLLC